MVEKLQQKTGALLSAENHVWFHQQTPAKQATLNRKFQEYKLGVLEISNGRVVQAEVLDLDFEPDEYYIIPLEIDDRKYNRSRVKKETQMLIDRYERGEGDGR